MKRLIVVLVLIVVGAVLWLMTQGEEEIEALAGVDDFGDDLDADGSADAAASEV